MRTVNGIELPRVLVPAQAERLGITRAQTRSELRRGNWQRLATGVMLTRPDEPTRMDWAEVGVALAGRNAALTGWDAARLRGIGDHTPPDAPVLVAATSGMNRLVGKVRITRSTRPFRSSRTSASSDHPMLPIVTAPRALADYVLLQEHDRQRIRAAVTASVQRRSCRIDELLTELQGAPRRGSRAFRSALHDAMDGARSVAEIQALRRLRRAPVPAFEMNVPIVIGGVVRYRVDFLWRELLAALEIDSREFHLGEREWKLTLHRHNELARHGLALTHYPPSEVGGRDWAGEVIGWLRARAAELGRPYRPSGRVIAPDTDCDPPPLVLSR